jgi:hypothetical protein
MACIQSTPVCNNLSQNTPDKLNSVRLCSGGLHPHLKFIMLMPRLMTASLRAANSRWQRCGNMVAAMEVLNTKSK